MNNLCVIPFRILTLLLRRRSIWWNAVPFVLWELSKEQIGNYWETIWQKVRKYERNLFFNNIKLGKNNFLKIMLQANVETHFNIILLWIFYSKMYASFLLKYLIHTFIFASTFKNLRFGRLIFIIEFLKFHHVI